MRPRINHDETVFVSLRIEFILITHVDQCRQTVTFKSINYYVSYLIIFIFIFLSHHPFQLIKSIELLSPQTTMNCVTMIYNEDWAYSFFRPQLGLVLQKKSSKFQVDDQCGSKIANVNTSIQM